MFGDNYKKQKILKSSLLILLVVVFYYVYYLIFGGVRNLIESLVISIATIPLDILLTGFIINYIVDKKDMDKKADEVNMIIGMFYNQVGTEILDILVKSDECVEQIRECALIKKDWGDKEYQKLYDNFNKYEYCVNIDKIDLENLKNILINNNSFFIDLVLNPMMQTKELFTETVIGVIHVKDELSDRFIGEELDEYEKEHIEADLNMAYRLLARRWVDYMFHLQKIYPEMFCKALITSPFDNRDKLLKDQEFIIK